jgi:hypothetical protein
MKTNVNRLLARELYNKEGNMAIKKPDSKFGVQDVLWLVFVFGFLIMVFSATGCKSIEVKKTNVDKINEIREF